MPVPPLLDDLSQLGLAGHDFFDPPEALLECLSRELGIAKLDYWPWNRGDLSLEAYRELLAKYEIDVYCVNLDTSQGRFGKVETEQTVGEAARLALAEARAFNAPFVQVYADRADGDTRADRVNTLVRQLTPIANECHEQGVMLVLENNFDARNVDAALENFSRSPSDLKEIVEGVGPERLGITLDPVNFVMTGHDPIESYDVIAPYVGNIHLKDCVALQTRDTGEGRKVLRDGESRFARSVPVGAGDIDWPAFVAHVDRAGFTGWWTVDPFCDPDDALAWTRQSLEFVRGGAAGAPIPSEQLRKEQP
jgi:sugar phosphate isomerase/epimerase